MLRIPIISFSQVKAWLGVRVFVPRTTREDEEFHQSPAHPEIVDLPLEDPETPTRSRRPGGALSHNEESVTNPRSDVDVDLDDLDLIDKEPVTPGRSNVGSTENRDIQESVDLDLGGAPSPHVGDEEAGHGLSADLLLFAREIQELGPDTRRKMMLCLYQGLQENFGGVGKKKSFRPDKSKTLSEQLVVWKGENALKLAATEEKKAKARTKKDNVGYRLLDREMISLGL